MSEAKRIAGQLERSLHGPAWHGPSIGELLAGMDSALAGRRLLPSAHNIWELVLHIAAWQSAALRAVKGEKMPELTDAEDWPKTGRTEGDWQIALESMGRVSQELVAAITDFPDDRLGNRVPGRDYSFYDLLHGVVQHNLYHAGQIALIKKAA